MTAFQLARQLQWIRKYDTLVGGLNHIKLGIADVNSPNDASFLKASVPVVAEMNSFESTFS